MIDLTMDDKEKADGDVHTAPDNKHTKLSSNATSSQCGMVMKIEVEDAADGSKRRRITHSNALGAIMHIHVEDAADGSKRRRITHANTRMRSSPVPNNVPTPNVGSRATATAVKASSDEQQQDARSMCTHHRRQVRHRQEYKYKLLLLKLLLWKLLLEHNKCGRRHTRACGDTRRKKGEATKKTAQERHYTKSR